MSDIRTEYTDELVCQYCHEVIGDSWEVGSGGEEDGGHGCGECGRDFVTLGTSL